jgi:hypothetical protein
MRAATSDFIGQVLSVLCVVHCAVTPVVLALVPAAANVFGGAHPVLLALVLATAVWAFIPGYRHHKQWQPLAIALVGLTFLALGAFVLSGSLAWDITSSVTGAGLMLIAHWKNRSAHRHHCHACAT